MSKTMIIKFKLNHNKWCKNNITSNTPKKKTQTFLLRQFAKLKSKNERIEIWNEIACVCVTKKLLLVCWHCTLTSNLLFLISLNEFFLIVIVIITAATGFSGALYFLCTIEHTVLCLWISFNLLDFFFFAPSDYHSKYVLWYGFHCIGFRFVFFFLVFGRQA